MRTHTQSQLLHALFEEVLDSTPDFSQFEHRVLMQKIVFLMHEKGISCGDYTFVWDQRGPFSALLSDDMKKECKVSTREVVFSQQAASTIGAIRDETKKHGNVYNRDMWLEALASVQYLKRYMFPTYSDQAIAKKLTEYKPNFSSNSDNIRALRASRRLTA